MIDGILLLWYVLTAGCVIFLVWDQATNTPSVGVMKAAWVLIMLYTGPVGLFVYLLSCRQPLPGSHDRYIAAHWKQTVGSMAHCLAGDATGIILAAAIVYHFGLPNGWDLVVEYSTAFVVGLLVFQALFMKSMFGDYWLAVRKTFFSETVSMNMVMVGMIPSMVLLMHALPRADSPWNPLFWGVMSIATMVGGITAYPINSWLVRRGFKHGMMSAPQPAAHGQATMAGSGMAMEHGGNAMGHGGEHGGHGHTMPQPSPALAAGVMLGTFALLLVATWITSFFAPISFG